MAVALAPGPHATWGRSSGPTPPFPSRAGPEASHLPRKSWFQPQRVGDRKNKIQIHVTLTRIFAKWEAPWVWPADSKVALVLGAP